MRECIELRTPCVVLFQMFCGVLLFFKMHNPSNVYFRLIFNSIPIINGGFITPISFYFLKSNLRQFYIQLFWEIAPEFLQRFNPGNNLPPKTPNAHNVSKTSSKPEIYVIEPSETGSIIANTDINDDKDDSDADNWWKQSAPGPSHQECYGNQQWYCEVHRVPLQKNFCQEIL